MGQGSGRAYLVVATGILEARAARASGETTPSSLFSSRSPDSPLTTIYLLFFLMLTLTAKSSMALQCSWTADIVTALSLNIQT